MRNLAFRPNYRMGNLTKTLGILLIVYLLVFGPIELYLYSMGYAKMDTIKGTIQEKEWVVRSGTRHTSYYLVYTLKESGKQIGMEISSDIYSANNLNFDNTTIGNQYNFYLNPAILGKSDPNDIRRIDDQNHHHPVFIVNAGNYLIRGVWSILSALILSLVLYGYYRNQKK